MQNESKEIEKLLLGILEITVADEIRVGDQVLAPQDKNNVIALFTVEVGRRLGFIDRELMDSLEHQDSQLMLSVVDLIFCIASKSKEFDRHGETRND